MDKWKRVDNKLKKYLWRPLFPRMKTAKRHDSRKCMLVAEFLQQLLACLATDNISTFIAFYSEPNSLKGLPSDTLRLWGNLHSRWA